MSWFPEVDEVDEWEPDLDADGNLIAGAPEPRDRSFATVEEAFESLESEHNVHDQAWRHESMIGDEYLVARSEALDGPAT